MKVTIVRPDNSVIVDGVGLSVDCSALPAYVHAIQWQDETGWIEFVNDGNGQHLPNLPISDTSPYTFLIDKWSETKAANEAAARTLAEADAADGWNKQVTHSEPALRIVSGTVGSVPTVA